MQVADHARTNAVTSVRANANFQTPLVQQNFGSFGPGGAGQVYAPMGGAMGGAQHGYMVAPPPPQQFAGAHYQQMAPAGYPQQGTPFQMTIPLHGQQPMQMQMQQGPPQLLHQQSMPLMPMQPSPTHMAPGVVPGLAPLSPAPGMAGVPTPTHAQPVMNYASFGPVDKWSPSQVGAFLHSLGAAFAECARKANDLGLDGGMLLALNAEMMGELGISSKIMQAKLQQEVDKLRGGKSPTASSSSPSAGSGKAGTLNVIQFKELGPMKPLASGNFAQCARICTALLCAQYRVRADLQVLFEHVQWRASGGQDAEARRSRCDE